MSRSLLCFVLFIGLSILFMFGLYAKEVGMAAVDTDITNPLAPYVPGRVIVKLNNEIMGIEGLGELQAQLGVKAVESLEFIGAELWSLSTMDVEEVIDKYQNDPRFLYIEPDYIMETIKYPDDPAFSELWGFENTSQTGGLFDADIDAPEAWELQTDCRDILIGVIDTGVDYNHPDLIDNIWTNPGEIGIAEDGSDKSNNGVDDDGNGYIDDVHGYDFFNEDPDPMDDNGHGTHVSGTIGAVGNNDLGVVGICWKARIAAIKPFSSGGNAEISELVQAVEYAVKINAHVTNNSWGGTAFSQSLYDAIERAGQAGMLFVAAAGNDSTDNDAFHKYPSDYDLENILSVAASDHKDTFAYFSNYGATCVDLAAPGTSIYSTVPNNAYERLSGTSMATPHVVGTAALVWSHFPDWSNLEVKARLLETVDKRLAFSGKIVSGGRLNAHAALVGPDETSPDPILDLEIAEVDSDQAILQWSQGHDDGSTGVATGYDLRFSLSPILTESDYQNANQVGNEPLPDPGMPDAIETFTVDGLTHETTYYFALKVIDDHENISSISNVVSTTTLAPPEAAISPLQINLTLEAGDRIDDKTIAINNLGTAGSLSFRITTISGKGTDLKGARVPIKVAVLDGIGTNLTDFWGQLNNGWADNGEIPVDIDYETFDGREIILEDLFVFDADAIVISDNWRPEYAFSAEEVESIAAYVQDGAGLIITGGSLNNWQFDELSPAVEKLAPMVGMNGDLYYAWVSANQDDYMDILVDDPILFDELDSVYSNRNCPFTGRPIHPIISDTISWADPSVVTDGTLVALGGVYWNPGETGIVTKQNRVYFSFMPEYPDPYPEWWPQQLFYNAIRYTDRTRNWLRISLDEFLLGRLTSSESLDIPLTIDARKLQAGKYEGQIVVTTNDPLQPEIVVEVNLEVLPSSGPIPDPEWLVYLPLVVR